MEIKTAKTERQEADEALAEAKAMRATEKAKFLKTSEEQRATIVWALAERFASLRDDRKEKKDERKGTTFLHFFSNQFCSFQFSCRTDRWIYF